MAQSGSNGLHPAEGTSRIGVGNLPGTMRPLTEREFMRRLLVVASLLALVATACKIETNIGAVINADGSGTVVVELGLDEEAQGFFLEGGDDPFEGNELSELAGARTRTEERGGLTYYIIEADVDSVEEIEDLILSNDSTLLEDFNITVTDTLVTITGTATAEQTLGEDTEGLDPSVLEDSFSAQVRFTMPGAIQEHNADDRDGNTLIWDVPILGGTLDIQAQSDPTGTPSTGGGDGGGIPVWVIVLIAAAVLAAAWYFLNQRNQAAAAGAGGTDGGDDAPLAPPATPPAPEAAPEGDGDGDFPAQG
jgi:hypothetical protein